jgi:hypothetical protein
LKREVETQVEVTQRKEARKWKANWENGSDWGDVQTGGWTLEAYFSWLSNQQLHNCK